MPEREKVRIKRVKREWGKTKKKEEDTEVSYTRLFEPGEKKYERTKNTMGINFLRKVESHILPEERKNEVSI